jgi:hypothetical protein
MTPRPAARRLACYRAVLVATIQAQLSDFYLSVKTLHSNDGLNSKFISAIRAEKVEVSLEWIPIEWEHDSTTIHSIKATQHRIVQKVRACEMIRYRWEVKHSKLATKSLIGKITLLYFEKGELNKDVKYFMRVLVKHGIRQIKTFFCFHEIKAETAARKRANGILNICNF